MKNKTDKKEVIMNRQVILLRISLVLVWAWCVLSLFCTLEKQKGLREESLIFTPFEYVPLKEDVHGEDKKDNEHYLRLTVMFARATIRNGRGV